jgi:methylated-DNA-[protein]-cysteine S-methyltransferase
LIRHGIDIFQTTSPTGILQVEHTSAAIRKLTFSEDADIPEAGAGPLNDFQRKISEQLTEYFSGNRRKFGLPLKFRGTAFQEKVWHELLKISYGEVNTYAALAKRLGDKNCIRAAASANARNPVAIIVPCHRVSGSGGKLTGYMGGLRRKQRLLEHEAYFSGYSKLTE